MVLPLVSGCGRRHTVTTPSPFGDGDFNPKRLPISQDSSSQVRFQIKFCCNLDGVHYVALYMYQCVVLGYF